MKQKKKYEIPDFEICRKYVKEAEKTDLLPESETEIITLDLDEQCLTTLDNIAEEWNTTQENVLRAMLIALVRENEDK